MWRNYDDDVVRGELQTLLDHGMDLTRSFFFWPDFHPAPNVIDEEKVAAFHTFLATSEEMGIPTIATFLVGHMSGQDWDVPWREGRDLYTDPFMLEQQAFFIREMVERFGDSPALAGWLITNEFTHYAGISDSESVRGWAEVCVGAIRDAGSTLPVSLGDGAWGMELNGRDNGFLIRDQLDGLSDFFGPHNYKMGTDQVRVHFAGAWFCELAHFGKPVLLEEFGLSSTHSSDENAAHLYRQNLHLSLLAGATGWIPWNNTDFALRAQEPYWHHPFELNFGITRADGSPKPVAEEVRDFRRVIDAIDFPRTSRQATGTSILLSSFVDQHPRIVAEERPVIIEVTKHAYIAGKLAGLAPAVQRELEEGTTRTSLVIVPSNKLLTATTFDQLEQWASEGSHVYLSWFSGVSPSHRGSWWPDVNATVGIPHTLRYGMREEIDDVVEFRFDEAFGGLAKHTVLRFPFAGSRESRHMLPLDDRDLPEDVTVIARDQRGRPALVRRRVGEGAVYVATYSIEYFASERDHAHADDDVRVLYAALAAEAAATPEVTSGDDRVIVDGLAHDDGRRFDWFVNVTPDVVPVRPLTSKPTTFADPLADGAKVDGFELPPFGVRVLERRVEGG